MIHYLPVLGYIKINKRDITAILYTLPCARMTAHSCVIPSSSVRGSDTLHKYKFSPSDSSKNFHPHHLHIHPPHPLLLAMWIDSLKTLSKTVRATCQGILSIGTGRLELLNMDH